MTTNHIDQLAEWWENAEKDATINKGDLVIEDRRDREGGFDIWPVHDATHPLARSDRRILSRAPKPKPAWHDAIAVIANADGDTCVWVRAIEDDGIWFDGEGEASVTTDDLRDVTPLIEAKVTVAAVRAVDALLARYGMPTSEATATAVTRAALGLETE